MPDEPKKTAPREDSLETGTYEILRKRLREHGDELGERLEKLNELRRDVFGSIEFKLLATERITTENNCVPRDMVRISPDRFLFGYNVKMGLKSETKLEDVFAIYEYSNDSFHEKSVEGLRDGEFENQFKELYKYYREATFAKFRVIGPFLYMAFQIGKSITDIKTFKWAIEDDAIRYIGNRFDHEFTFPPQHDFEWKRSVRDTQRHGEHPHISIEDRVFIDTLRGDLTVKIEDNTASGEGIYKEPVENPDQTLDDAEVYYATVGNLILLKIKPFQERDFRYLVYNEKVKDVRRIDAIEKCCVLLPDGHGIIFFNGYYLQTGEHKLFETDLKDMLFSRRVDAPNGEDYLYAFHNRERGMYMLLSYNRIEQHVETPIVCNGYSIFESGKLLYFRTDQDPQKHHAVQIWQTPYLGKNVVLDAKTDSFLYKLGNPTVVACMAECHEVLNLISKEDTYENLYLDLVKKTSAIVDSYFWLDDDEAYNIREPLNEIRKGAESAIEEFEKVHRIKRETSQKIAVLKKKLAELLRAIDYHSLDSLETFVKHLAALRAIRGEIISAKDLRYVDEAELERMEEEVEEHSAKLSGLCIDFLLEPEALKPYEKNIEEHRTQVGEVTKVAEATELEEELNQAGSELEMLIEIVSNLKIEDSTQTTQIIDNISTIYSGLNQVKSILKNRKQDLGRVEGAAQFGAQLKLFGQAVTNYLDLCDTAEKCDEYLTRLMVQIEELEGRFADFDEYVAELVEKREEVYGAFSSRKLQITENRNRRATALYSTAERILNGIKTRAASLKTIEELNGYFATDLMIEKVRDVADQLTELEDTVKADEILGRLKTLQQDAVRQLKDRNELFVDGQNIIKMGDHKFFVNTQPLDCTLVYRDGEMFYHLTGTNYFEKVADEEFLSTREVWGREGYSESPEVYRAEYLAYLILRSLAEEDKEEAERIANLTADEQVEMVRRFMAERYAEGYVKGVHDVDANLILGRLLKTEQAAGLLRYKPAARAAARIFWEEYPDAERKAIIAGKLKSHGRVGETFAAAGNPDIFIAQLRELIEAFAQDTNRFTAELAPSAAEYLFHELSSRESFVISREAADIVKEFKDHLRESGAGHQFDEARSAVAKSRTADYEVIQDWLSGFLSTESDRFDAEYLSEAAALLQYDSADPLNTVDITVSERLKGLVGSHPLIRDGAYQFNYHEFIERLSDFDNRLVPAYRKYVELKNVLLEQKRDELKLSEFKPKVLSSFVRNRLIDRFYLPLVGANMAKQIGVAGELKRTDRSGLLLVVSPPGYGKTTLMEYISSRVGLVFMKINGPALGERVLSLDPDEAPNAAAREEVNKLNLALEMGDNVMIYLDDIQHCNTEFLQKFISLCDSQRRIEGVWKNRSRTYDLRGRKVMVVMAGNPYTESGEKFRIPDMLANRADTYNLGDIVSGNADAFKMSYIENSITSNASLARLGRESQKDVQAIIRLAESATGEQVDLEGAYSAEEVNEMVAVMKKLVTIREAVMGVNSEYIRSAAQAEEYRTEPAFRLQGSYRNMNRLAEKVVPIMNESEIDDLIHDHYKNEAQTLTTGAEANLLKFKELYGSLNESEAKRWAEIKKTFKRNLLLGGAEESDPVSRVVAQMVSFREGIDSIRDSIVEQASRVEETTGDDAPRVTETRLSEDTLEVLKGIMNEMHASQEKLAEAAQPRQWETKLSSETVEVLKNLIGEMGAAVSRVALAPGPPAQPRFDPFGTEDPDGLAVQSASPAMPGRESLTIDTELELTYEVPLGKTVDFPPQVLTVNGNGFRKNAHLYIYDKAAPVAVRSQQTVTNNPLEGEELEPFFDLVEETIGFQVISDTEARITYNLKEIKNKTLEEPLIWKRPFTIVNPNGKYAPYSMMAFHIIPISS